MPFKAEGVPLATCLIAVDHALLETVRMTFSTLNTSNQGRHIKVIFFFNIRFDLGGCCRWYLNVRLLSFSAIQTIMIFSYRHISGNVEPRNFSPRWKKWISKLSEATAPVRLEPANVLNYRNSISVVVHKKTALLENERGKEQLYSSVKSIPFPSIHFSEDISISCTACNNLQFLAHVSFGRFFRVQFLHGEEIMDPPISKGVQRTFQRWFLYVY